MAITDRLLVDKSIRLQSCKAPHAPSPGHLEACWAGMSFESAITADRSGIRLINGSDFFHHWRSDTPSFQFSPFLLAPATKIGDPCKCGKPSFVRLPDRSRCRHLSHIEDDWEASTDGRSSPLTSELRVDRVNDHSVPTKIWKHPSD